LLKTKFHKRLNTVDIKKSIVEQVSNSNEPFQSSCAVDAIPSLHDILGNRTISYSKVLEWKLGRSKCVYTERDEMMIRQQARLAERTR
jgi:hypothetical protein